MGNQDLGSKMGLKRMGKKILRLSRCQESRYSKQSLGNPTTNGDSRSNTPIATTRKNIKCEISWCY